MSKRPLWPVLSVLLLSLPCCPCQSRWKDCAVNAPLSVQDVVLKPEHPNRGHPMQTIITSKMSGSAQQIERGSLQVKVYYMGMSVYTHTADLCQNVPTGCPILPSTMVELNSTEAMPSWAPTGSYSLRFEGTAPGPCASTSDEGNADSGTGTSESCVLLCVDIWFTMGSGQDEDATVEEDEHAGDHFDDLDEHFEL